MVEYKLVGNLLLAPPERSVVVRTQRRGDGEGGLAGVVCFGTTPLLPFSFGREFNSS